MLKKFSLFFHPIEIDLSFTPFALRLNNETYQVMKASDELIKQVADQVAAGESKKDAIKSVAKANKVSKNELYDKYHQN